MVESEDKKELDKLIKTTNISNTHDRLTNEEFVNGLKKYVNDMVELSKTNLKLAKESALQALINTGVLDENGNEKDTIVKSYVDDKKLSKPFVKSHVIKTMTNK